MDGCSSHYSEYTYAEAKASNELLQFLPENATHLFQPLDRTVRRPFTLAIRNVGADSIWTDVSTNIKQRAIAIACNVWASSNIGPRWWIHEVHLGIINRALLCREVSIGVCFRFVQANVLGIRQSNLHYDHDERRSIYESLLAVSSSGILPRGAIVKLAMQHNCHPDTVKRVWARGQSSVREGHICADVASKIREMVLNYVVPAIKSKFPRSTLRSGVIIQHDIASPHKCLTTSMLESSGVSGIAMKNQPPNSPDFNVLDL
ncbi:hypothetical protein H257_05547 [Aphanomyces astaci]|uniref:DUF7769 domain-containing protein n=1 Tax=Aphanomyces astaci TaxID=112090 RepID=W4GQP4_APHAT|nr:hypothetical protein H257_05547 [Aphanomyces astaci]ETV82022.1 hypothetical protein H257_05547 [Aphanomyces astaci]|eukprot:XP_009828759.1 hypothetical protein H257_05547 [Aphanomyces astaci]